MTRRRALRPADYVRCTGCGRLVEKDSVQRGPEGGKYGPECMVRAMIAHDAAIKASET